MTRQRLFWQFYISYLLISTAVLIALTFFASKLFTDFFVEETASSLTTEAKFVSPTVSDYLADENFDSIDKLCKELGTKSGIRLTVILPSGKVVGDSDEDILSMDNHADRPEVISAIQTDYGVEKRFSDTLNKMMMYVAVPLKENGKAIAVLRTSKPLTAIETRLKTIYIDVIKYCVVIAIVAALISLYISRRINRPLESMTKGAESFANGNFNHSLEIPESAELASLAMAMNKMAKELDKRIKDITERKNEMQAILSNMAEGVLAVDSAGVIFSVNSAAKNLLDVGREDIIGKNIEETIRNAKLQDFVKKALTSDSKVDTEITITGTKTQHIHAYGKSITSASDDKIGAIVVLNDITLLRQLEKVRSEFVANVSHELKTPITSIKGFVETLLDGAIEKPEEAKRFLSIIARQTNRLNSIIEDILILSKIEDQSQRNQIVLQEGSLKKAVDSAIEVCHIKAKEKNITIEETCPEITVKLNDFLLEQAIVNIISNAIKYSNPDKKISIDVTESEKHAIISVADEGFGIPQEHLERIFERFYVTDKARSRNLGGTGLGLAIVKHIAQAHGGFVTVKSELGKGSTFAIHIPK